MSEAQPGTASARRLAAVVVLGLVVRLLAAGVGGAFEPPRTCWQHGYEPGAVAVALAEGRGMSDPFLVPTGPTANVGPVIPAVWSLFVRAFGPCSPGAWRGFVLLDIFFSTCCILAAYHLGRRVAGPGVGLLVSLVWALHPVGVVSAGQWLGSASLFAVAVTLVLERAVGLEQADEANALPSRGWPWSRAWPAGLMLGASLWVEPHLLPFGLGWLGISLVRRRWALARAVTLALALAGLVASPWAVRNVLAFGEPVFLRSWAGPELLLGAVAGPGEPTPIGRHPTRDPGEMARLVEVGEAAYAREKLHEALRVVRQHPGRWAAAVAWRMGNYWLGRTSWWRSTPSHPVLSRGLSMGRGATHLAGALLAGVGLVLAWRRHGAACRTALLLLLATSAIYALTHVEARYRLPLEPTLAMLGTLAVLQLLRRRREAAR